MHIKAFFTQDMYHLIIEYNNIYCQGLYKSEFIGILSMNIPPQPPLVRGGVILPLQNDGGVVNLQYYQPLLPLSQPSADSSPDKGSLKGYAFQLPDKLRMVGTVSHYRQTGKNARHTTGVDFFS
jgi:hypothetical protein